MIGIDDDGGRGFRDVSHRLHGDPKPRPARHRPTVQAKVQELLDPCRIEHRHTAGLENKLTLMRQSRALSAVIVASDGDHAAMWRRSGRIGMFKDIATAIDSRAFAVPETKYAIGIGTGEQADLLGSPNCVGRQFFIDARPKDNLLAVQMLAGLPERLVERAEWRTAITRNKASGAQACNAVSLTLQHWQSNQGLIAVHKRTPMFKGVLVIQRYTTQRTG